MRIGFIGAGKVGFTLGRHLVEHGFDVAGYCSKSPGSALEAAQFTGSEAYGSSSELASVCDMVFLTVPDDTIPEAWGQLDGADISGKLVCHTSGSLSSEVFDGIRERGAYGYSVHPLFPISSKHDSYKEVSRALIALEGDQERLGELRVMFEQMGHTVVTIDRNVKTRYHAAAVFGSNLVVGLFARAQEMLVSCGFSRDEAALALAPLFKGNCDSILAKGPEAALTGPVERGDACTVERHLNVLDPHERDIYLPLSRELLGIAQRKNPGRSYSELGELLGRAGKAS